MSRRRHGQRNALAIVLTIAVMLLLVGVVSVYLGQPLAAPVVPANGDGRLTLAMLDVGQGDSIILRSPSGKVVLIDAGPSDEVAQEVVLPQLRRMGVSKLDYLVLTHPHQDHVGGMPLVLRAVPTEVAVLSGEISSNAAYRDVLRLVQSGKAQALRARRGTSLDLGEGATVEVLNPPDRLFEGANDNSIVLRVSCGNASILLMGDAERAAIGSILEAEVPLRSAVLKVGHHGSSDATTRDLLQTVGPRYALISVGADNEYGHPHKETLSLLGEVGARVYRTDQLGTITVTTDGQEIQIATHEG